MPLNPGQGHHPDCAVITYRELSRQWEAPLPPHLDTEWADQAGVYRCHVDCPSLAASIKRGRELAELHGWP